MSMSSFWHPAKRAASKPAPEPPRPAETKEYLAFTDSWRNLCVSILGKEQITDVHALVPDIDKLCTDWTGALWAPLSRLTPDSIEEFARLHGLAPTSYADAVRKIAGAINRGCI